MLTVEQALQFLRDHQPMPSGEASPDELFVRYDEVRRLFTKTRDTRCLPLFLGSFGDGDGHGNYQLVEDVFRQFTADEVILYLSTALAAGSSVTRYWAAQIACSFPSEKLIACLVQCLQDQDPSVRYMTIVCLEQIQDVRSRDALANHRNIESEEDILKLLDEVLAGMSE
jgi:hypothetical protein